MTVAKFTDPLGALPIWNYSAEIDWPDGTKSAGVVAFDSITRLFTVSGDHVFGEQKENQVRIIIHRTDSPDTTAYATAVVTDAPLVGAGAKLRGAAGETLGSPPYGVLVATFQSIGGELEESPAFTAQIDWGDGQSSPGTAIATEGSGVRFSVNGLHVYSTPGVYAIVVTVSDGTEVIKIDSTAVIAPQGLSKYQQFVSQMYGDLLHRLADAGGLDYWAGRLAGGMSQAELAANIENTAEYRHDEIDSLFVHYLHRHADPGALDSLSAQLAAGTSDEAIAATIAGSDEYFKLQGGTNDGFLAGLFSDALGRTIDPGAKTALEQALTQGASRLQIGLTVLDSHEYHLVVVENAYAELLNRSVDAHWADALDRGLADEQLLESVAESQEYFKG